MMVVVMAALALFFFWQRTGVAALLGMTLFAFTAVVVERLVHTEYVLTGDGRLVVRRGRWLKEKNIPLADITEVKEVGAMFGFVKYVLVSYGAGHHVALQPANAGAFIGEMAKRQVQYNSDNEIKQDEI